MVIKNKTIKKNYVKRNNKCNQDQEITNICLNKSKFLSLNNVLGIPNNYTDVIKYKIDNKYVNNIYLLSHDNESFINDEKVKMLVNIIDRTCTYIYDLFSNVHYQNNKFNLILLGSEAKKYFPERYEPLTEDNINSAETTFYWTSPRTNDITIRIYRKEELVKVLIHEVIHYLGVDKIVNKDFENIYNVVNPENNNKLIINETVTETLATYINCFIINDLYSSFSSCIYPSVGSRNLEQCLNNEIKFGMLQTAKILHHFGFTSIDNFLNNKNNNKKIIQKTAVFEYHILKTIFLLQFDKFIKTIKDNEPFDKIIMNTFQNKEYQKKINKYIEEVDSLPENIKNTFRMTMCQINL